MIGLFAPDGKPLGAYLCVERPLDGIHDGRWEYMNLHPAYRYEFDELVRGLNAAVEAGYVNVSTCEETGACLYNYSVTCVADKAWNDFTRSARGLILDLDQRRIIASPLPKFFNAFELGDPVPSLPFDTFEKADGSLMIIYHWKGKWRTATRGSFKSDQAKWAKRWLQETGAEKHLHSGTTYLAEAIYPENRIVVDYKGWSGLMFITAYRQGYEIPFSVLHEEIGSEFRFVERHHFDSVDAIVELCKELPKDQEGFVVRFDDGHRLKIKGEEYLRIHRAISSLSPLSLWESMWKGDDMQSIRLQLPEEFWSDFDTIVDLLSTQGDALLERIRSVASETLLLSDKELGLTLKNYPADVRDFLFPWRKRNGDILADERSRRVFFQKIRPHANKLDGYTPTSSMRRVQEDNS